MHDNNTMTKLSILIPTIKRDELLFNKLKDKLLNQSKDGVTILVNPSETDSIGKKRNWLLDNSHSEYVAFIDADDYVVDNYIDLLLEGISKRVDCCSLMGIYAINGKVDGFFEHSLKYKEWKTNDQQTHDIKYERYPNHLNCIKSSIAKQFKFPEKNFGEDHDWSKQIHESGLIKTEHYIDQVIYYYKKVTR